MTKAAEYEQLERCRAEEQLRKRQALDRLAELERLASLGQIPSELPTFSDFGLLEADFRAVAPSTAAAPGDAMIGIVVSLSVLGATAFVCVVVALATKVLGLFWFGLFSTVAVYETLKDSLSKHFNERYSARPLPPQSEDKYTLINRISVLQRKWSDIRTQLDRAAAEEERRRAREEAERQIVMRRQTEAYWQEMSGRNFEIEIGNLFALLGYEVEVTPAANDYGIDIKLRKDNRYAVVQCKRQVAAVGRPVLQQLFGVMHAEGADECILVCTGGFNRNAVEFAKSRPICLVGLDQIIAHACAVGHPSQTINAG